MKLGSEGPEVYPPGHTFDDDVPLYEAVAKFMESRRLYEGLDELTFRFQPLPQEKGW